MKNLFNRVVILLTLVIFLLALPVEIVGLIRNQKAFEDEADEKIKYAIQSAATDLNVVLSNMENLVTMLHSTVQATFSGTNYVYDPAVFSQLKRQTGNIIKDTLKKTERISGLYVTFSPSLHSGMEEVWYAYRDGKITFIDARLYAPSWLLEGNPRVDYYYDAIKNGEYWGADDYESSLDEYMATHTQSIYDNEGNLIGIAGSDMLMSELRNMLSSIKIYRDSQIVLFDSDMNYCASNIDIKKPTKVYSVLINEIGSHHDNTTFHYTSSDGQEYIAAYTTLNNDWILVATQTTDAAMASATETRNTLIATMMLTILIIVIIVLLLIKRYYEPVIESAEQNEILMINQSRQAKLGEMVGNISHQCKQPLNNINIDISNMRDDYMADELTEKLFNEYAQRIRENVSVMANTITDFADFLKPDRNKENFSIRDSVNTALSIMKESLVINEIIIINSVDANLTITNYRNEFIQCVFNILENARDAVISSGEKPGRIVISADEKNKGGHKITSLNIFNSGSKIPAEQKDKIFTPYFSTKEADGGTGIGLYIVKQIIERHFHGNVSFVNCNEGVIFTITVKEKEI